MCPYGTYQRALSSANLSIAAAVSDPAKFEAAMLSRLSKKGKAEKAGKVFVEGFLTSARQHLENDYSVMRLFSL
jgi:hypothetical protein